MRPQRAQLLTAFPEQEASAGRLHLLDTKNAGQVAACEQAFYASFLPVLEINPLLREIWQWDHTTRRLRLPGPPEARVVVLLSDPATGDLRFVTGVTLDLSAHWQAGIFGFPLPDGHDRACEFPIMARGPGGPYQHGVPVRRDYVRDFLLGGLARLGYRDVWATTADHLLPLYRWLGATFQDKRIYRGHSRTLLHWKL